MIQLRKWFPFVFPTPYDVRAIAAEKRAERLEYEYKQAVEAEKVNRAVDALRLSCTTNGRGNTQLSWKSLTTQDALTDMYEARRCRIPKTS